jgi:hypothetical protein
MALIRVDWRSTSAVAPKAAATGEAAQAADANTSLRLERPMMVYIPGDDDTDSAMRKVEDVVFANEQFSIGAKFFDAVKVSAGDSLQDRILADAGRETPRIVFLKRDYTVHSVLQGKAISAGRLVKAMAQVVREEYDDNFDSMLRDYVKLLNERDRIEGKRTALADQKARLADKPNASKGRKLERDEQEIAADLQKWEDAQKALLNFRRKGEDNKPAA